MSRMGRVLLVLALAACDGGGSTDIEGTLRFADLSDVEISRLINAATGSEGFQAQAIAESYADPFEPDDPCPARSLAGNVGTITGGCTTQDGVTLEGSIAIKNPLNWCLAFEDGVGWCDTEYEGNWNEPTEYTFSDFAITQAGFKRAFDGRLTSATIDGYIDMDITSVQLDVAVRSDIYAERDGSQRVDINGSGIELVGGWRRARRRLHRHLVDESDERLLHAGRRRHAEGHDGGQLHSLAHRGDTADVLDVSVGVSHKLHEFLRPNLGHRLSSATVSAMR